MTTSSSASSGKSSGLAPATAAEVDLSCRFPVLFLLAKSVGWLVLAGLLKLILVIKLWSPGFLASCPYVTYGRLDPMVTSAFIYGFAIQAVLGVSLWMISRLGRQPLPEPFLSLIAALFYNLGVLIGVVGIMMGYSTGMPYLEMPRVVYPVLFASFSFIAVWALVGLMKRRCQDMYISQWFLVAALLWFPWSYVGTQLLLGAGHSSGIFPSVAHWWYSHNLLHVFAGCAGLGVIYYFLPRLTGGVWTNRPMLVLSFWSVVFCGTLGGIPSSAPVPAWLISIGVVGSTMFILPGLIFAANLCYLSSEAPSKLLGKGTDRFFFISILSFFGLVLMTVLSVRESAREALELTQFMEARDWLGWIGFLGFALFGAIYYIVPRISGMEWPSTSLSGFHFWCSSVGLVLVVLGLAGQGFLKGYALSVPQASFEQVMGRGGVFGQMNALGWLIFLSGQMGFLAHWMLFWQNCCMKVCCGVAQGCDSRQPEVSEVNA